MVLDVLVACHKTMRHMSDLKPFHKRRYVSVVLASLELHNMGNSKWDSIVLGSESKVLTSKWNGKNFRYTLARHIYSHISAHNDMVIAEDRIGYHPPNEYTWVQRLLKSIYSTDIRIISAITTIFGDTFKRGNF